MGLKLISPDPVTCRVRPKVEAIYDVHGRMIEPEKRAIVAQFERKLAPEWARQIGLAHFSMKTAPEFDDDSLGVGDWIAYLDTDREAIKNNWSAEEKQAAEARLTELAGECGYIIVEKPLPTAPYSLYDQHRKVAGRRTVEHAIQDIRAAYASAGFDVAAAVLYERETLNDPKVLEFLGSLVPAPVEDPEEELVEA